MNQAASASRESVRESIPHTGAPGTAQAPRRRGTRLLAPLRWLGRTLSRLVRAVAEHLPAPLRWLGRLFVPGGKHGFGFWWLMATLCVALALALVVALLLAPVAGLLALLVVAIWALVRHRRRKRDDRD
jgi:apolipoprotein N-acyltransferase